MLWANGAMSAPQVDNLIYFHQHSFNVGQHVAHNEMLDYCVKQGIDWHIRMDDDCWMRSRTWLPKLLHIQEQIKTIRGRYAVLGIDIIGLDAPPPAIRGYEMKRGIIDLVEILGGIFRMSHMGLMRYFRWDERQAMGFGDATQFRSFCESTNTAMFRVRNVHATHGESTRKQNEKDLAWGHQHDMDQYLPVGL